MRSASPQRSRDQRLCCARNQEGRALGGCASVSRAGRRGRRGQEPRRVRDGRRGDLQLRSAVRSGAWRRPSCSPPQGWGHGLPLSHQEGSSLPPGFNPTGQQGRVLCWDTGRGGGTSPAAPHTCLGPAPGGVCPRSLGLPGRPRHETAALCTGPQTRVCRVGCH